MHLHYLLSKGHKSINVEGDIVPDRISADGEVWLGIKFPANQKTRLSIKNPFSYNHFKAGADDIGFHACLKKSPKKKDPSNKLSLRLISANDEQKNEIQLSSTLLRSAMIPNVLDLEDPFGAVSFCIEADRPSQDIFLATSRRVDRKALYRLAKGTGIEIGPGPRPQIKNSEDTKVTYIEEKGAEEWLSLYNSDVTSSAWTTADFKIGKAHDLPVEDESLDFVFSSHVLEHLYNPLGHLEHWHAKLKQNGLILGVVPASDGTKDFLLPRTRVRQLVEEYQTKSFDIPISAYQTWVKHHQPHQENVEQVAKDYFDRKFSIHVHVYDNVTISNLLDYCVTNGGYSDYRIFYRRNAKDFAFALKK